MKICNIYQIIKKAKSFPKFFNRKKLLILKDGEKIKNWFSYRNRKMTKIIKQAEMTPSFVAVKPVLALVPSPSFNSDIYFYNIATQIFANNVMMHFNALFQIRNVQQVNANNHFAVKREI